MQFSHVTQGRSQVFLTGGALSGAKQQIVRLASRVRWREESKIELRGAQPPLRAKPPVLVRGAKPPENFQDFKLILDPESTCKWNSNKESNSNSRCKNEQATAG